MARLRFLLRQICLKRKVRYTFMGTLLDLAACSLPCLLLLAAIDYAAWSAWWI